MNRQYLNDWSLSLRRAWIEIHGHSTLGNAQRSLSLRRAWIEIPWPVTAFIRISSRSPYGERGLKFALNRAAVSGSRRSPYGERGLKFIAVSWIVVSALVALLTESVD